MTKPSNPWVNDTLPAMLKDLWPGSVAELARDSGLSQRALQRLFNGEHQTMPVLLLESLAEFKPVVDRAAKFGVTLTADMLRKAWTLLC